MAFVDIVGLMGFCCSMILITSPSKAIYEGIKNMEIKNMAIEYFLIGMFQSTCWATFGHKSNDFYVILSNDSVIILFTIYLNCFLYINRKTTQAIYYNLGIFFLVMFFFTSVSAQVAALVASVVNCLWHFSTIRNLRSSLTLKDGSYINLLLAYISLVTFGLWFFYSLLTDNYAMAVPNFIGLILWGMNIVIYYWTTNAMADDHIVIKSIKLLLMVDDSQKEERLLTSLKTAGGVEKL